MQIPDFDCDPDTDNAFPAAFSGLHNQASGCAGGPKTIVTQYLLLLGHTPSPHFLRYIIVFNRNPGAALDNCCRPGTALPMTDLCPGDDPICSCRQRSFGRILHLGVC